MHEAANKQRLTAAHEAVSFAREESMDNHRRPSFISSGEFRQWMTKGQVGKLFEVDGIKPASYIYRCERLGKPIKCRGTLYRPLDVIAKAWAEACTIQPTRRDRLIADIKQLEEQKAKLESELNRPAHQVEMSRLSIGLTDRVLLTEQEIVCASTAPPHLTGVYFLVKGERVIYVGQSVNILSRVSQHRKSKDFDRLAFVPCAKDDLDVLESLYIHALRPESNGMFNGKSGHHAPMNLKTLVGIKSLRKHTSKELL